VPACLDTFTVKDGSSFKPDMTFIDDEESEAVNLLLCRLVGEKEANAAQLELLQWTADGTTSAMVDAVLEKAATVQGWMLVEDLAVVKLLWKAALKKKYPILSGVALRLLSMHATSCSCERLWSLMRWIYRPNRTRLSLEKSKMMATVTFNEWLQRRNWREDFTDAMDSLIESVIELDEGNVFV